MLLNILKCDGCKKEMEYTKIIDTTNIVNGYTGNERKVVGKVFLYHKNNGTLLDRYTEYHLCNKCFDQLKEKLDNVIAEFKGDDCSQEDISIMDIILDSDVQASTKALVSHAVIVTFANSFVFHFQQKYASLLNQKHTDRITTVLSKHFKRGVEIALVSDTGKHDSCDCGQ